MLDSTPEHEVFNRIVTLRDSWAKRTSDEPEQPEALSAEKTEIEPENAGPSMADRLSELSPKQRERFDTYTKGAGLNEHDALVLAENREIREFFEAARMGHADTGSVANWVINELPAAAKGKTFADLAFGPEMMGELIALIEKGVISRRIAKDVLAEMVQTGQTPTAIVDQKGLEQVSDTAALAPIVDRLLDENPEKVAALRAGKTGLLGFFVGQVMRETQGKADPKIVQQLLSERLG
jgi:glutaminyl-tRNA synthetase